MTRQLDRLRHSWIGQQFTGSHLKAQLVRSTSGVFVMRIANTGLRFVTSWALARLLGADGLGVFNFATAWITVLMVVALFGLDRLMIRELAVYASAASWALMRGVLRYATRVTLGISLVVAALVALAAWLTYQLTGRPALFKADQAVSALSALHTLWIALIILPLWSLALLQQAAMQGLHRVVIAQLPEQLLRPVLFLAVLAGAYAVGDAITTPQAAMLVQLAATVAALGYSAYLLRRMVPAPARQAAPAYQVRLWTAGAIPLAAGRGLATLNMQVDPLLLGVLRGTEPVALFSVALQVTQLIALLQVSINMALGPNIAQFYSTRRMRDLQRAVIQSVRLGFAATLVMAVGFGIVGNLYLGLFGSRFTAAANTLRILMLGQLVNVGAGPAGLVLIMTNQERRAMLGIGVGVAVHIALIFVLLPYGGIAGAAWASTIGLVVTNLMHIWYTWRYVGVHTTILGDLRRS